MTSSLGGDAPIERPEDDLLGFASFADALATGLVERAPDTGFVVGLQARWGMGKSSAVNLCLNRVRESDLAYSDARRVVTRSFNPWFFVTVDALTKGYLSLLGDAVEEAISPRRPRLITRLWRQLRGALSKASEHADAIGSSVSAVGAAAATVTTSGASAAVSGAVRGMIVAALKTTSNSSLRRRFDKLTKKLGRMEGRVLIVVDDLDRLQPSELRQTLTLVKTFGNLPQVTHLLVYDRNIVDSSIADLRGDAGERRLPTYREKIVQAEFDLPPAGEDGLKRLIARGIDPLISNEPEFDQMDWYYAINLALSFYLKSPRDVVRFTNTLSVTWPTITGEAYFPDLFVMELWRLFERDFYEGIREHRAVMVSEPSLLMSDDERRLVIEAVVNRVPDMRRQPVVRIFHRTFPKAAKYLPGNHHWGESPIRDRWRVGTGRGFDAFFRMSPPLGEYTQREREHLRDSVGDAHALNVAVTDASKRVALTGRGTFLPKLLAVLRDITSDRFEPAEPLLETLLTRGEEILRTGKNEPEMEWWGARMELSGLVHRCLLQIPEERRLEVLRTGFREAGLSTRALVITREYEEYRERSDDEVQRSVDPSALKKQEVERLAQDFASALAKDPLSLLDAPIPWQALLLWETFESSEQIKKWIGANIHDPALIVLLVDMVMADVQSTGGRYRELRGPISWTFFDLQEIARAAKKLRDEDKFSAADKELIDAFLRDAAKRLTAQVLGSAGGEESPTP
ncbi:MAG TPA: P-loop NTPase fold protein [Allosphingosinicella sp.]|jgi:hypothetical protein